MFRLKTQNEKLAKELQEAKDAPKECAKCIQRELKKSMVVIEEDSDADKSSDSNILTPSAAKRSPLKSFSKTAEKQRRKTYVPNLNTPSARNRRPSERVSLKKSIEMPGPKSSLAPIAESNLRSGKNIMITGLEPRTSLR